MEKMAKVLFDKIYLVHGSKRFTAVKVQLHKSVMFACDVLARIRVNELLAWTRICMQMHCHASSVIAIYT